MNKMLTELLRITKQSNSIEVQQIMADVYETQFGIFDQISNANRPARQQRPLASVAYFPQEDFRAYHNLATVAKLYIQLGIYDLFHIPLDQFVKLPAPDFNDLVKIAEEHARASKGKADDAKKNLEKQLAESLKR